MGKSPGNTGLISQRKNYSKNLIPPSRTLQTVEEILPGEGKIFTAIAPSRETRHHLSCLNVALLLHYRGKS
jgi:hypothetical protein